MSTLDGSSHALRPFHMPYSMFDSSSTVWESVLIEISTPASLARLAFSSVMSSLSG